MHPLGVRKAVITRFVDAAKEREPSIGDHLHLSDEDEGEGVGGDFEEDEDGENESESEGDVELNRLSDMDQAHYLELKSIESRFDELCRSSFNIASLEFIQDDSIEPKSPTIIETLNILPPSLPATKHLAYRLQGFQTLIATLEGIECSADLVDTYRVDLIMTILVEFNRLLVAVWSERSAQRNMEPLHAGLHRIHLGEPNPLPCLIFIYLNTIHPAPLSAALLMSPIVRAVLILIAIVHCMMGVARNHCNLILKCLRAILLMVAEMHDSRARFLARDNFETPVTLPTALHYLGLLDSFDLYVVCPACWATYKESPAVLVPDNCMAVNIDGVLCGENLFKQRHRGNRTWRKPRHRFSHQPLESWLARFLSRPDIESMIESTAPSVQSTCTDIWGATYFSDFPGNGEPNFFSCPTDELQLAFLIYHDFYNPFSNKQSGKKCSMGVVLMACLNLPPDVRYDLKNIYVTAVIPGPKEPTLEHINSFMQPIAEDLEEHYSPGVFITKTAKHPQGRKVRSAVPITSMDIPASRAWGGIGSASHTIFCSFCNATLFDIDNFDPTAFSKRSMDDHLIHVRRWLAARSSKERDMIWEDHAARHSEWLRFPWWDVFSGTTVAPMHWTKNVLEKQIRENMGCSTTIPAGMPSLPPPLGAITPLELRWGNLAMAHLSEEAWAKGKLTEMVLRHLCRERGIFEAGLSSSRLTYELGRWVSSLFILCFADAYGQTNSVKSTALCTKMDRPLNQMKPTV